MRIENFSINSYSGIGTFNKEGSYSYDTQGISFGQRLKADTLELGYKKGKKTVKTLKDIRKKSAQKSAAVKVPNIDTQVKNTLNKFKEFSVEEYQSLTKEERVLLRTEYRKVMEKESAYCKRTEQLHDVASDNIRDYLDDKYGEGKYKVIIIGRSLSSIGKVLGYKIGKENVINIPMSSAGKYRKPDEILEIRQNGQLDHFREFLAEQGLEKDKISKSKKKYVIMDYCYSGNSLQGAKNLLTQPDVLGKKNISALDVSECISNFSMGVKLDADLRYCRYKDYSFVSETYGISDTKYAMRNLSKADKKTKLMWFTLLDNQMLKAQQKTNDSPKKTSALEKLKCKVLIVYVKPLVNSLAKKIFGIN